VLCSSHRWDPFFFANLALSFCWRRGILPLIASVPRTAYDMLLLFPCSLIPLRSAANEQADLRLMEIPPMAAQNGRACVYSFRSIAGAAQRGYQIVKRSGVAMVLLTRNYECPQLQTGLHENI
jgi:hypothetical protein